MDERAVWSAVIAAHPWDISSVLPIDDSTLTAAELGRLPDQGFLREIEIRFPDEPIQDLARRSAVPASLPPLLGELPGVRWVTAADRQHIDEGGGDRWARFQARFPGARSVALLSRVGFDGDRRWAAVYLACWCGPLCGGSRLVLLKRCSRGRWTVFDQVPLTIS